MEQQLTNLETDIQNLETSLESYWWKHQENPDEKDFDRFFNLVERLSENIKESFNIIQERVN